MIIFNLIECYDAKVYTIGWTAEESEFEFRWGK
jgi:hypothetical protein